MGFSNDLESEHNSIIARLSSSVFTPSPCKSKIILLKSYQVVPSMIPHLYGMHTFATSNIICLSRIYPGIYHSVSCTNHISHKTLSSKYSKIRVRAFFSTVLCFKVWSLDKFCPPSNVLFYTHLYEHSFHFHFPYCKIICSIKFCDVNFLWWDIVYIYYLNKFEFNDQSSHLTIHRDIKCPVGYDPFLQLV